MVLARGLWPGRQGALGDSARGTTVNIGAQLTLDTQASPGQPYVTGSTGRTYDFDSAEPLVVGGQWNAATAAAKVGIGASALYNLSGISRLTGGVTLLGSSSAASPQVTQVSAAASSKLFLTGPVSHEAGKYADLVIRVANIASTPGQISLGGALTLGSGKLTIDGTDDVNGGAVALLAGNSYSGGTTIGTAGATYTSVVAGASGAFGTGDVTLAFGNIAAAANLNLSAATFTLVRGSVWAAASIPAKFASTDFDDLKNNPSSIEAYAYDLQGWSTSATYPSFISVPMRGGAGGVTKTTANVVTLDAANEFTGTLTVGAGILMAKHSQALGSTAAGTMVSSGGTLALSGGLTIGDDLTLSGAGASNSGALRSDSGANTVAGDRDPGRQRQDPIARRSRRPHARQHERHHGFRVHAHGGRRWKHRHPRRHRHGRRWLDQAQCGHPHP